MVWSPKENDAFFGEPQEDAREPGAHADDAETMCVWCETRVRCACKSHYDTLTCTHRVIVPTAEEWDSSVEARAAELHEGCRMPMEQARELAASEAAPDWYARGQEWGLADALTNGQSGDWVLDDIARAFAAGAAVAYAHGAAVVDKCNGYIVDNARLSEQLDVFKCRCVALEEQADLTAIHLARMQSALQDSGSRSADYLRKAIKAEAEVALLRAALTLPADVEAARQTAEYWKAEHLAGNTRIGELHDEAERMRDVLQRILEAPTTQISVTWKDAVRQALTLGPNVRGNAGPTAPQN